jgi:hypothetical protein
VGHPAIQVTVPALLIVDSYLRGGTDGDFTAGSTIAGGQGSTIYADPDGDGIPSVQCTSGQRE